RSLLAADVVGFSKLAGSDEERTLARLRALRSDLIDPTKGFADLGEKELKNIARPVRVFAIKTASSGVTQELIASTPELGGDPEQEYFGGRQARRCAIRRLLEQDTA